MRSLVRAMHRFMVSDDGPTAVEYAVMLMLILLVCLAAIGAVGTPTNAIFNNMAQAPGTS
jgi:pilus assembly protein Flp/PilA